MLLPFRSVSKYILKLSPWLVITFYVYLLVNDLLILFRTKGVFKIITFETVFTDVA